jgi:pimeloyl-ACP methyl ester carboxylesterase
MKLSYRKIGNGKPLFILHGLFGSSDNWQTLAKSFGEWYTVYLIDLRNHGRSPHSEEFNYQVMAEDIYGIITDEGIDKVSIIGHSLGGKVAMQVGILHPEKIDKMVVVDIGPKKYPVTNQFVIDALDKFDPQTLATRKEVEALVAEGIEDMGTRQFILKNLYWDDNQKLQWRFDFQSIKKSIKNVGEPTPVLAQTIEFPILFLKGERSDYIFPSDEKLIKSMFSNARLEVIAGAGHWVHADKPQEFFNAVTQFLRQG